MKAGVTLVAAAAIAAGLLLGGPTVAEALLPRLPAPNEAALPAFIETLYIAVFFGGLLIVAAIGGRLARRNSFGLGHHAGRMAVLGAVIGSAGILAAVIYAWLAGAVVLVSTPSFPLLMIVWGAAAIFIQAGAEEVYFRGWLQPVLMERWGAWPAILATTFVFAGLHMLGGAESPTAVVNLFLGGLLFGMLAARTGGIAAPAAAHILYNGVEQLGLGLIPNPGIGSFGTMIDLDLVGDPRWGGSAEGLNASAAMTMSLIALLVPLLLLWSFRRRPVEEPKRVAATAAE